MPALIDGLNGLGGSILVPSDGGAADQIFTKKQFLALCHHMLNGNPQTEFLHVYCDSAGNPRWVKAKTPRAKQRSEWAWHTITGRAKNKVAIGFYPWNEQGATRWGAMDFDAHSGEAERAKQLAAAAFAVLNRHPELYLLLCTSGSEGHHLFAFTENYCAVDDWIVLLKRTAELIGAQVRPGECEIFPNETRVAGRRPRAIRAPGTWNPKKNQVGAIIFESVQALLSKQEVEEVSPFLYHSRNGSKGVDLNDRQDAKLYTGGEQQWLTAFGIIAANTRHQKLLGLVAAIYHQVVYALGRGLAEAQYKAASPAPIATLIEHLREFDDMWKWKETQWRAALTDDETRHFQRLTSESQRAIFRVCRNFASLAQMRNSKDFPVAVVDLAARASISFQQASVIRRGFVQAGILTQTAPFIANRAAARFNWACVPIEKATPYNDCSM